jgi:hypothetical protein
MDQYYSQNNRQKTNVAFYFAAPSCKWSPWKRSIDQDGMFRLCEHISIYHSMPRARRNKPKSSICLTTLIGDVHSWDFRVWHLITLRILNQTLHWLRALHVHNERSRTATVALMTIKGHVYITARTTTCELSLEQSLCVPNTIFHRDKCFFIWISKGQSRVPIKHMILA